MTFESSKTVEIVEERGKGTRGGSYVYVVEGNELVHISEYALRTLQGKYRDEVVYEVPVEKVREKVIYCFDFSRSGGEFLCKCKIEDFQDGRPRGYEYFELLHKRIPDIRNLRFKIKDPALGDLISEFYQLFIPMINELREYERAKNFECSFMGHLARLENAFEDLDLHYFAFMSLPSDKGRVRSLRNTRKWIYQLWVLKLVCECLQVSRFSYHMYEGKSYWWIKQGSDLSTCIGETPFGEMTFWLEFQPSRGAHMIGMFAGKHVAVRPDIVIARGHFERTKSFASSGKTMDVLIECKEDPYDRWEGEVRSQILPYLENFKPKLFLVASLKSVPVDPKNDLQNRGIKVIDNLKPNSGSINALCNLIRKELTEG